MDTPKGRIFNPFSQTFMYAGCVHTQVQDSNFWFNPRFCIPLHTYLERASMLCIITYFQSVVIYKVVYAFMIFLCVTNFNWFLSNTYIHLPIIHFELNFFIYQILASKYIISTFLLMKTQINLGIPNWTNGSQLKIVPNVAQQSSFFNNLPHECKLGDIQKWKT